MAPFSFSVAPTITTSATNSSGNEGGSATFSCDASGHPQPMFNWEYAGSRISGGPKYTLTLHKNLMVSNLVYKDRGEYTCAAENSQGTARTAAYLTVHGKKVILCVGHRCVQCSRCR